MQKEIIKTRNKIREICTKIFIWSISATISLTQHWTNMIVVHSKNILTSFLVSKSFKNSIKISIGFIDQQASYEFFCGIFIVT